MQKGAPYLENISPNWPAIGNLKFPPDPVPHLRSAPKTVRSHISPKRGGRLQPGSNLASASQDPNPHPRLGSASRHGSRPRPAPSLRDQRSQGTERRRHGPFGRDLGFPWNKQNPRPPANQESPTRLSKPTEKDIWVCISRGGPKWWTSTN